jgi:hypothetical protein
MNETSIIVIGIVAAAIVAVIMWRNPKIRKYGIYALILIPGVIALFLLLFKKKDPQASTSEFNGKLEDIKDSLTEANIIADLKSKYIKEKNDNDMKKLAEVTSIEDKTERRKQLAALIG